MYSPALFLAIFGIQGILATPLPQAPTNTTLDAPIIFKNPLQPPASAPPTVEKRMAACPGTSTIGIATPIGKGVNCPSTAEVKNMIPVAPPKAKKVEQRGTQKSSSPLDALTGALGGGLPVPGLKEKRGTQKSSSPLDALTGALGGGLPVPGLKEKRGTQKSSSPLDALTGALGGGLPVPGLKEKRGTQKSSSPLDALTGALGGGLPVPGLKEKRGTQKSSSPLDALTGALGGGLPVPGLKEKRGPQLDALTGLLGGKKAANATQAADSPRDSLKE